VSREFSAAEIRVVEALSLSGPPLKNLLVFGRVVVFVACKSKVGLYNIGHVSQNQCRPLLTVVFNENFYPGTTVDHRLLYCSCRELTSQFIAPNVGEPDRIEDVKPIDNPSNGGPPVCLLPPMGSLHRS
jgi:hypothetical protein